MLPKCIDFLCPWSKFIWWSLTIFLSWKGYFHSFVLKWCSPSWYLSVSFSILENIWFEQNVRSNTLTHFRAQHTKLLGKLPTRFNSNTIITKAIIKQLAIYQSVWWFCWWKWVSILCISPYTLYKNSYAGAVAWMWSLFTLARRVFTSCFTKINFFSTLCRSKNSIFQPACFEFQ